MMRKQAGDTIVEVLISISVVSLVLGGAFAIAQRSLKNSRQAQEHSEALQLANKQVELLSQYFVKYDDAALRIGTSVNCLNDSVELVNGSCSNPIADDNTVDYRTSLKLESNAYRVSVTWPSATGTGNDTMSLVYRPYKP